MRIALTPWGIGGGISEGRSVLTGDKSWESGVEGKKPRLTGEIDCPERKGFSRVPPPSPEKKIIRNLSTNLWLEVAMADSLPMQNF